MSTAISRAVLGAALACCSLAAARAADGRPAEPQNVVTLAASASTEVARDLLSVVMTTARDGTDAAQVQAALKQALDAALAEARKAARPGQVDVQTGEFLALSALRQPGSRRHADDQRLAGHGRTAGRGARHAGHRRTDGAHLDDDGRPRRLRPVARAREKVEADVSAQAIARFRARATEIARQFGFARLRDPRGRGVDAASPSYPPVPMMRMQAMAAASEQAPLPVEAGRRHRHRDGRRQRRDEVTRRAGRGGAAPARHAASSAGGVARRGAPASTTAPSSRRRSFHATPRTLSPAGEHRNTASSPSSSGVVNCSDGCFSASSSLLGLARRRCLRAPARASTCFCTSGVSTQPGQMALTVMPVVAVSSARPWSGRRCRAWPRRRRSSAPTRPARAPTRR